MTAKPHILIVDDEAGIRESLSSILRDEELFTSKPSAPPKKPWNASAAAILKSFFSMSGCRAWTVWKRSAASSPFPARPL